MLAWLVPYWFNEIEPYAQISKRCNSKKKIKNNNAWMCKDEKFKNLPKRNAQFILRKRFFEKNSLFEEKQVCPFF